MCTNRFSCLIIEDECINVRKNAYQLLSNKKLLKNNLYKTSMCTNKNCNVVNCPFAHSTNELRIRNCIFGNECLFIHSTNKPCRFKHPNESKSDYFKRTQSPIIKQL